MSSIELFVKEITNVIISTRGKFTKVATSSKDTKTKVDSSTTKTKNLKKKQVIDLEKNKVSPDTLSSRDPEDSEEK